jgi:hypothetical protein
MIMFYLILGIIFLLLFLQLVISFIIKKFKYNKETRYGYDDEEE